MIQRSTIDPPAADSLPPEMEQRLMGVLEKYLEDIEQGFAPDAEQLLAEHPDLAEPLRSHLDSLNLLYQMGAEMSPLVNPLPSLPACAQNSLAIIPFCAKSAVAEWGWSTKPGRSRWTAGWL